MIGVVRLLDIQATHIVYLKGVVKELNMEIHKPYLVYFCWKYNMYKHVQYL